jgi:hypothetical protein
MSVFDMTAVQSAFNDAVARDENIDEDGSMNWDFVSADVFMDVIPNHALIDNGRELQDHIDSLIDVELAKA